MSYEMRTVLGGLLFGLLFSCGCATNRTDQTAQARSFDFSKDTFAYPNELLWEYHYDANGKWTTHKHEPKPTYAQHCFVVARCAKQFFEHARFDSGQPVTNQATYRQLMRRVISSNPRGASPETDKIVIPGYSDLRAFSEAQKSLLKEECGGAWQSYFQRGHWRMIFPFSRHHQEHVAAQLLAHLREDHLLIVHLVRFPQLTINHAVVIFDAKEHGNEIDFMTYDQNQPEKPVTITYDRAGRTFFLPANNYYPGGRVDAYEIFHRWDY